MPYKNIKNPRAYFVFALMNAVYILHWRAKQNNYLNCELGFLNYYFFLSWKSAST